MKRLRILSVILLGAATGPLSPLPAGAHDLSIGINIGIPLPPPPPVVVTARPALVVVPGTAVYYAPALPHNYFFYAGHYYTFHDGAWFYKVPPGHLRHPHARPPGHW